MKMACCTIKEIYVYTLKINGLFILNLDYRGSSLFQVSIQVPLKPRTFSTSPENDLSCSPFPLA
jgi:hypothetical protein